MASVIEVTASQYHIRLEEDLIECLPELLVLLNDIELITFNFVVLMLLTGC
jgi:hypothetical protein